LTYVRVPMDAYSVGRVPGPVRKRIRLDRRGRTGSEGEQRPDRRRPLTRIKTKRRASSMRMHKGWLLGLILVLTGSVLSGCLAGEEKSASDEGLEEKVVVYSPHGKDILSEFEKQFEKEHPGVDVQWLDIGSQEILDRIRSEKANPQADVWWGAPSVMFEQARAEGLLEPYEPSYKEALPEEFRAEDFSWTGTSQTPEVIMYNSKLLSKEEAPKDWD